MGSRILVSQKEIREKVVKILTDIGVPGEDAALTADILLDAELRGVESHGLMRVKTYAERIRLGLIEADPEIRIELNGAVARVDGGNGLGQVVMARAASAGIDLAKKYGIGMVTVCHSNHFAAAGYYAEMIAKERCIGIVTTAAAPVMAPYGGREVLLGTDPVAIAFPAAEQTFYGDISTSASSRGKIRVYSKTGREIPSGWALDRDGNDTTDAAEALEGILLPMSGHKGYILAMAIEAACCLLSGANLSCESSTIFDYTRTTNTGHSLIAVDIAHFLPPEEFEERAQQWFDRLRNSTPQPGHQIQIPGEMGDRRRREAGETISVLRETVEAIDELSGRNWRLWR
ncbi:MAG: Ldh family oxidoreductase [Eubacteriales bacterium]|nr:Ldh family oxidoreductase [Eubacteriales bacterium]